MMENRDSLILYYPPTWHTEAWRESLPLGDGRTGALVAGGVLQEQVILNDGRLWTPPQTAELPDVSDRLATTRRLMDAHRYREAAPEICRGLIEKGYAADVEHTYPLAQLTLSFDVPAVFEDYARRLDMRRGLAEISYAMGGSRVRRRAFVSRETGGFYYVVEAEKPFSVEVGLGFVHTADKDCAAIYEQVRPTISGGWDGRFLTYAAANGTPHEYGAVATVCAQGGELHWKEGRLCARHVTRLECRCLLFVGEPRAAAIPRLQQALQEDTASFDFRLERHAALHGALYGRVDIDLGGREEDLSNEELLLRAYRDDFSPTLARKLWAFGRYLYIAATREGGLPAPMYGLWHGQYRLIWGIHMANINLQMMNWHAPVGALTELLLPLIDHYLAHMDTYRDNARKLFGCRGIYIPAITTPRVHSVTILVPVIVNWTGGAGWLAQHFYQYYQFTGDKAVLREKILPFLRECALFYEDFLVEGPDGLYQIYPSVSPENTPGNFMPEDYQEDMGHIMPSAVNATMDFAILRELLTNLIHGAREAGMYADETGKWEAMLDKIPPYALNEDGALREWQFAAFRDNYNHRHYSHLYPLFPGNECIEKGEAALIEGCREALKRRILRGQSGWSFAMTGCEYARLGDGEKALASLKALAKGCLLDNFFTLHNDWRKMGVTFDLGETAPVQLDAILGVAALVQEMLLYCSATQVRLLPALPAGWARGEVRDLRFHTGRIGFAWDRQAGRIRVHLALERDTAVRLCLPAGYRWEETDGLCVNPDGSLRLTGRAGETRALVACAETAGTQEPRCAAV